MNETIKAGDRVETIDEFDDDIGTVHEVDGDYAFVGWDSGVSTQCRLADLRRLSR